MYNNIITDINYLQGRRPVWVKTEPEVMSMAQGQRLKTNFDGFGFSPLHRQWHRKNSES